jgi:hypothetical protein
MNKQKYWVPRQSVHASAASSLYAVCVCVCVCVCAICGNALSNKKRAEDMVPAYLTM